MTTSRPYANPESAPVSARNSVQRKESARPPRSETCACLKEPHIQYRLCVISHILGVLGFIILIGVSAAPTWTTVEANGNGMETKNVGNQDVYTICRQYIHDGSSLNYTVCMQSASLAPWGQNLPTCWRRLPFEDRLSALGPDDAHRCDYYDLLSSDEHSTRDLQMRFNDVQKSMKAINVITFFIYFIAVAFAIYATFNQRYILKRLAAAIYAFVVACLAIQISLWSRYITDGKTIWLRAMVQYVLPGDKIENIAELNDSAPPTLMYIIVILYVSSALVLLLASRKHVIMVSSDGRRMARESAVVVDLPYNLGR